MATTGSAHIQLDAAGVAWIDDTNVKVIEVALDRIAHGWSPEEIHFQHARLSLAQIHAALSYYYDHQPEFDRQIEAQLAEVARFASATPDSPLRERLRRAGKLP